METALAFAEAGVEGVILADLNEPTKSIIDECRRFSKLSNLRVVLVQTDVADEDSVAKMVGIAVKEFGRIDYCVHFAGVSQPIFIWPIFVGLLCSLTALLFLAEGKHFWDAHRTSQHRSLRQDPSRECPGNNARLARCLGYNGAARAPKPSELPAP
jgi:NAD(P)-dependent dehydrogenase (short-subunit alcohol dehydrogenase family)